MANKTSSCTIQHTVLATNYDALEISISRLKIKIKMHTQTEVTTVYVQCTERCPG